MTQVLRLGFAGLGEAATMVLPDVLELPFVKVTAAADLRKDARDRFREELNGKVYDSIEELCQSPEVDAVYIATPHELHAKYAVIALQNRKHVIVEKPMALTLEDCERMNAAADQYGVKLLCGHTHSFDPPIKKMREIIASGELGRVCMINTWNYNDFMVRPYPDQELTVSRGVVLNQGPHQVDIVRLLGGGMVRSVRAMAGRWDPTRPGEGGYLCYLEFQDGTPASLAFNGYGFFDIAELHWWLGEGGQDRAPETNQFSRKKYTALTGAERERVIEEMKEEVRYGQRSVKEGRIGHGWDRLLRKPQDEKNRRQPFFGLTIVTCEKGEMRQTQDGIMIYGNEKREVLIERGLRARRAELTELYEAVVQGRKMFHDGRWGQATLEVCLAILQSSEERREITLKRQVPVLDEREREERRWSP